MNKRIVSLSVILIIATLALSACGVSSAAVQTAVQAVEKAQAQVAQAAQSAPAHAAQVQPVVATVSVPAQAPLVTGPAVDLLAAYQGTLETLYTAVSPSVVNISVVKQVSAAQGDPSQQMPGFPFFGLPQGDGQNQGPEQFQGGLGSGFVWDAQGHIVTNNHVVEGADKIEVTFSDGTTVPAELVAADPDSDLAVIKVDAAADLLRPVQLADSAQVKVGQMAIAIGNPYGLEGTMTSGIVSAVGRSMPAQENAARAYTIPDIIQTDAPINPGNSGGVLVDVSGQVIGVTTAIQSTSGSNAGIGFAVPSGIVKNVVPALISTGKYVHTWLGISGASLTRDVALAMDLDGAQRGALVGEVMPGSPAEKAGLRGSEQQVTMDGAQALVGGDVITAIDGQPVRGMDDVIAYLTRSTQVGQTVSLTILRSGKQQ
ncbi:MAG: S1C family serine protease [Chloroflexota bacterium]